jgi:hypothetical protein
MDRLTKKLKKGGYSANRNPEEKLQERLDQLLGVHKFWLQEVKDMEEGMKQAQEAGPEAGLTLMMLHEAYNAIVRMGRRFETAHPMTDNEDDLVTQLGKLEDLYETCLMEVDTLQEGLAEIKDRGYQNEMAYNELMTAKLGVNELIKRFEIAVGEREDDPDPHAYWSEERKALDQ